MSEESILQLPTDHKRNTRKCKQNCRRDKHPFHFCGFISYAEVDNELGRNEGHREHAQTCYGALVAIELFELLFIHQIMS